MGMFRRASAWFSDIGLSKWGYGAGLAYATVILAIILTPSQMGKEGTPGGPVSFRAPTALLAPPVQQLNRLDLSPLTQGMTGEQIF